MRADRVVFTLLGAVLGATGVWLLRSDRTLVGADPTGDTESVARLTRRVAELEAEARRPAELAAPVRSAGDVGAAPAALPDDTPADPGTRAARPDGDAAPADPASPAGVAPLRFFNRLQFVEGAALVVTRVAEPSLSAAEVDSKLRSGSEADRDLAIGAIVSATSRDYLAPALLALEAERREPAQRRLIDAIARLKDRRWSAIQATGAPDTPIGGDLGTAWASANEDMGEVTLDLTYERAVRVDRVRIHETHAPGAISKILAKTSDGAWDVLWEGRTGAVDAPHWFAPPLAATRYATATIRLVLDTDRVPDWNEIDAVELEGDGIRQWASGATASSSFADR